MSLALTASPPRTLLEVFKSLPEGTLVQLIENKLIMSPAPLDIHQKLLSNIYISIGSFVKQHQLGETRVAPYDVYFDEENVFQPDIIFINNDRLNLIEEDGLHGAPDLVIEILSPSTAKYDLTEKKAVYEKYGVKEYWIVDPKTKSAQGFVLHHNVYEELDKEGNSIHSSLLHTEFNF